MLPSPSMNAGEALDTDTEPRSADTACGSSPTSVGLSLVALAPALVTWIENDRWAPGAATSFKFGLLTSKVLPVGVPGPLASRIDIASWTALSELTRPAPWWS